MSKIINNIKIDQDSWYIGSIVFIILIIIVACHTPKDSLGENSIHIPKILLENNTYHGTIYLEKSTNKDTIVFLTSSYQNLVLVSRSIIIPQGVNQGVFEMQTLRSGSATMVASIDGEIIHSNFTITSEYEDNFRLGVYTFPLLKTDQITGMVYLLDENNIPISLDRNIQLTITTTGSVTSINNIYILKNHTHTVFEINVDGDGELFVSTKNVASNSTMLEKLRDEMQVVIHLAPNVLAQGGHGYAIISIEKNEKPFISVAPIRVYLTSNNTNVVDLTRHTISKEQALLITNGSKITDIYAKNEGVADIHAISPEIGTARAQVRVVESTHISNHIQNNQIKLWAYPNVTADRAFGIISLYNINSDNIIIPILDAEKSIFLASQGLLHKPIVKFSPTSLDRQSIIFDIKISSFGNHILTATGTNLKESETSLTAIPILHDEFQFKIIPLPIKMSNEMQDLALVAITDQTGSVIDAEINFGKFPPIEVTHSDGLVDAIITKYKNVAIISGSVQDEFKLTVFFENIKSATKIIQPKYNPTNISLWIPAYTHAGEKFPFTIHKVNADGTPVKMIENIESWSATHKTRLVDGNFLVDSEGMITITIHTDSSIATANTHTSINQMSFDVNFEDVVKVNKTTSLHILTSTDNVDISLNTDIPYEKVGEKLFILHPNEIGTHDIIITAKKSGFVTQVFPIQINVKDLAYLSLFAYDSQGNDLNVVINLNNMNHTIKTPMDYSISTKTKFIFPPRHIGNNLEYTFDKLIINEKQIIRESYLETDADTIIHAIYKNKLKINIIDGIIINDTRNYGYGDKIIIQPDKKSFILIHESFLRWDGLPTIYDPKLPKQEIILQEDLDIRAIHDVDYTGIMLVSGGMVTIIALKYLGYDIVSRIIILYHRLIFHVRIIHKNKGHIN